jgi:hypothetical protein
MRPDFETMSGPELVDVYNKLATEAAGLPIKDVAAVKRFKSVDIGRKRCSELWIKITAAKSGEGEEAVEKEKPNDAPSTEAVASQPEEAETSSEGDVTMATRKKSSKASKANARGKTKGATKKGAKGPAKKRAVKAFEDRTVAGFPATSKIEVLVPNPRREGTAGHKRFAQYASAKTIAEYYKRFPAKAHSDIAWDLEHKHIKIVKKA